MLSHALPSTNLSGWEAGALFGTLIDYWWLTGDKSYNEVVTQGMMHQAGKDSDFMPENQTLTEGNDDQGFWALAAMSAAERKFPDPPDDKPQWLALAQAVFNEFTSRWDPESCGGGVRWQIFTWNTGFDYKNSISNGCFFNIAARLALYTGNETYSDWADKVFDWEKKSGLITDDLEVMDGLTIEDDKCPRMDKTQWTYNAGIYLHGAAVMYNLTEKDEWKTRVNGFLNTSTTRFVKNDIVYEQPCEEANGCTVDQQSFKGYLIRWLAATTQVAPWTSEKIMPLIKATATNAASTCTGPASDKYKGPDGTACGFTWLKKGKFDGNAGIGAQMDALSAVMYTLTPKAKAPVTSSNGGSSKGNPSGGSKDSKKVDREEKKITTADRVGAGIVTTLMLAGLIGGCSFIIM